MPPPPPPPRRSRNACQSLVGIMAAGPSSPPRWVACIVGCGGLDGVSRSYEAWRCLRARLCWWHGRTAVWRWLARSSRPWWRNACNGDSCGKACHLAAGSGRGGGKGGGGRQSPPMWWRRRKRRCGVGHAWAVAILQICTGKFVRREMDPSGPWWWTTVNISCVASFVCQVTV